MTIPARVFSCSALVSKTKILAEPAIRPDQGLSTKIMGVAKVDSILAFPSAASILRGLLYITLPLGLNLIPLSPTFADSNSSFYPTWKLLKPSERKLFLSGYLHGWRDSKRVTEIVKAHIEANPDQAVASLEKIRNLYGTADLPVEALVERLTRFYSDPENHDAPLSVAVSSAR